MWGCTFSAPGFSGPMFLWGGGFPGLLLKLLLLAALVWIVLRVFSGSRSQSTLESDQDHSLRLLKVKYAQGEIDDGEYRRMREVLES